MDLPLRLGWLHLERFLQSARSSAAAPSGRPCRPSRCFRSSACGATRVTIGITTGSVRWCGCVPAPVGVRGGRSVRPRSPGNSQGGSPGGGGGAAPVGRDTDRRALRARLAGAPQAGRPGAAGRTQGGAAGRATGAQWGGARAGAARPAPPAARTVPGVCKWGCISRDLMIIQLNQANLVRPDQESLLVRAARARRKGWPSHRSPCLSPPFFFLPPSHHHLGPTKKAGYRAVFVSSVCTAGRCGEGGSSQQPLRATSGRSKRCPSHPPTPLSTRYFLLTSKA